MTTVQTSQTDVNSNQWLANLPYCQPCCYTTHIKLLIPKVSLKLLRVNTLRQGAGLQLFQGVAVTAELLQLISCFRAMRIPYSDMLFVACHHTHIHLPEGEMVDELGVLEPSKYNINTRFNDSATCCIATGGGGGGGDGRMLMTGTDGTFYNITSSHYMKPTIALATCCIATGGGGGGGDGRMLMTGTDGTFYNITSSHYMKPTIASMA